MEDSYFGKSLKLDISFVRKTIINDTFALVLFIRMHTVPAPLIPGEVIHTSIIMPRPYMSPEHATCTTRFMSP